ncbi:hypothetical protein ACSSWA_03750 [Melioribacter sp. Ez-97]|uniref:hypothetical protein n=1 Tax=Melioribacter sp. Ez-97 TaxID=3423434 RepID=UPI003EDA5BBA
MTNSQKLLKNKTLIVASLLLFLAACEHKKETGNEVARIGDAVLTEEDIEKEIGKGAARSMYREQFINDWIEKEALYQKAIDEGVTESDDYIRLIENSKKELAGALLIEKYLKENPVVIEENELIDFYEKYKQDFALQQDAYLLNYISFNNAESAGEFRRILIESDWNRALNVFRDNKSIIENETGKLFYEYQITPIALNRIVKNLYENEVSVVTEVNPGKYAVVQYLKRYAKGTLPELRVVKNIVYERCKQYKQKEKIKEYIERLVMETEIKRESE